MNNIVKVFIAYKLLELDRAMGPLLSMMFETMILERMLEEVLETEEDTPITPETLGYWYVDFFLSTAENFTGENDEHTKAMSSFVGTLMPLFEGTKYKKILQDRIDNLDGTDLSIFEDFLNE